MSLIKRGLHWTVIGIAHSCDIDDDDASDSDRRRGDGHADYGYDGGDGWAYDDDSARDGDNHDDDVEDVDDVLIMLEMMMPLII